MLEPRTALGWLADHLDGRVVVIATGDELAEACSRVADGEVVRRAPDASEPSSADVVVVDGMLAHPRLQLPTGALLAVREPHGHHRVDGRRPLDVAGAVERLEQLGFGLVRGTVSGAALRLLGRSDVPTDGQARAELLAQEHRALLETQARAVLATREVHALQRSLVGQRAASQQQIDGLREQVNRRVVPLVPPEQVRIARLEAELERVRARADRLARRASVFEERATRWQSQAERMASRRWWQLGELLGRARRSPRVLVALPLHLLGLLTRAASAPATAGPSAPQETAPEQVADATVASPAPGDQPPSAPRPELAPGSEGDWIVPEAALPPAITPPVIPKVLPPMPRPRRSDVRVAAVVDPFSEVAFGHEVDLVQLSREGWREELERVAPDVLLVESAWQGKDGGWLRGVGFRDQGPSDDLRGLVAAARAADIPTVFWNKEDPPNHDLFAGAAALFDRVYTVDVDCVDRYAQMVGADRVGVLPFAAQPAIHNPARVRGGRAHELAFAGTYFPHKHQTRREQMAVILDPAREFGLHIFSRNEHDPRYRFPEPFDAHVVGSLDYDDMVTAYKRYKVFLNVNSVVGSRTTCSRRIFELLGSGTPVVSGVSPAIGHLLGPDVVLESGDRETTRTHLRLLLGSAEARDRMAVRGLRAVHAGHTYAHRIDTVLADLGLRTPDAGRVSVSIIAATMRPENLDVLCENVRRQTHPDIQLVLVTHGFEVATADVAARLAGSNVRDIEVVPAERHESLGTITTRGLAASDGRYVAKFDDDDHYGAHYLQDQLAAFDYTDADIVGKRALYYYLAGMDATVLRSPGREHSYVPQVSGATMMAPREVWDQLRFPDLPRGMDTEAQRRAVEHGMRIYATDRFNFCVRRGTSGHTWDIEDEDIAAGGRVAFYGWNPAHVEV